MNHLDHLVQALADRIRISVDTWNANAELSISVDGGVTITLEADPTGRWIFLYSILGPQPSEPDAVRVLLRANHLGRGTLGATLSIDPADDTVTLWRRLEIEREDAESFIGAFGDFLDAAVAWAARLPTLQDVLRDDDQSSGTHPFPILA